jgi:hypothetical protein
LPILSEKVGVILALNCWGLVTTNNDPSYKTGFCQLTQLF